MKKIPIVDGHLDLAENVTLFGRDLTRDVAIRALENWLNFLRRSLPRH